MPPCPICSRPALPRSQNDAAPFCTPRCKQIDLGKWFSDGYRIPTFEEPDEMEAPAGEESQ
jgi:endogenous inhibitor of DNA gyrase (YacG/DUF329 family)